MILRPARPGPTTKRPTSRSCHRRSLRIWVAPERQSSTASSTWTLHADDLTFDLEVVADAGPDYAKLHKALREFGGYIRANAGSIPNYGERHRAGEVISSSFVESAVNQVISKRMVKRQQMRWTPRGAHLLLQVRTRILNDELVDDFRRWHPSFTHVDPDREELTAAA